MKRTSLAQIVTIAVLAVFAAACGGGSSTGSSGNNNGSSSGRPTSGSGKGKPVVDLTFTGDVAATAKGSAGQCMLGHDSSGTVITFGFNAAGSDYPGLGNGGNLNFSEDAATHKLSVKWLTSSTSGGTAWFGYMTGGATISPDHHSLGLDADLPETPGHPEHVRGAISCP